VLVSTAAGQLALQHLADRSAAFAERLSVVT
jgi:hypothetical protein